MTLARRVYFDTIRPILTASMIRESRIAGSGTPVGLSDSKTRPARLSGFKEPQMPRGALCMRVEIVKSGVYSSWMRSWTTKPIS